MKKNANRKEEEKTRKETGAQKHNRKGRGKREKYS